MPKGPKSYVIEDEKDVGMSAKHAVHDSASEDGHGGTFGEKGTEDSNQLKRQLKNRHIAMIRLVD